MRFSKRDTLILAVVTLVIILIIVYAQFFKLSPMKSDLTNKQQALKQEQKLLEIVSQKKSNTENQIIENTRELQKVLPVRPLQEQIILDLEKAEAVSNSQILSMGFSKDGEVAMNAPAQEGAADQQNTSAQAGQKAANQETQPAAGQENTANQAATSDQATAQTTTSSIKKLTVQLSVESPSYAELEKFVETLEALKRIVVVEMINYSGGQEATTVDQQAQKLTYSLTISAFYMPELEELESELPIIESPAPAGKTNPLTQSPTVQGTEP